MQVPSESFREEESRIKDAYAKRKNSNFYSRFNPAYLHMVQEREQRLLALLVRYGWRSFASKSILEIGCGEGDILRDFIKWGARPENIVGIDLIPERVAKAIELCPKGVKLHQGSAAQLPFPEKAFDLVMQSTVFTSVLDAPMKMQIAAEMRRVLTPDGLILWYDYHMNNPNNPDVRGVKAKEIHALFPGADIRLEKITLAPPLARLLAPYSWLLCDLLSNFPFLCTHYLGVIRNTASS